MNDITRKRNEQLQLVVQTSKLICQLHIESKKELFKNTEHQNASNVIDTFPEDRTIIEEIFEEQLGKYDERLYCNVHFYWDFK